MIMSKQESKIDKTILGVAGEYYVAAELGRRNVYAQLTLGNQKRVDLLIFEGYQISLPVSFHNL